MYFNPCISYWLVKNFLTKSFGDLFTIFKKKNKIKFTNHALLSEILLAKHRISLSSVLPGQSFGWPSHKNCNDIQTLLSKHWNGSVGSWQNPYKKKILWLLLNYLSFYYLSELIYLCYEFLEH